MYSAAAPGSPISDFGALSNAERDSARRNRIVAAWIWLVGVTGYLVCEAIAAAQLPGYSYANDYISDLGVSAVMNVGAFIVHGSLFLLGAVVLARTYLPWDWLGWGFVLAATANAIGNVLVGVFRSGNGGHVVGAGLAIVGGNVAVILAGIGSRRLGATRTYRAVSIAIGVFGIACLLALLIDGANGSRAIPVGIVERGAVYSIMTWEVLTAAALLAMRGRCSRR